jgi:hypothetical protein
VSGSPHAASKCNSQDTPCRSRLLPPSPAARAAYVHYASDCNGSEGSGMVTNGQWQRISNDSVCAVQTINSLVLMSGQGQDRTVDLPLFRRQAKALSRQRSG